MAVSSTGLSLRLGGQVKITNQTHTVLHVSLLLIKTIEMVESNLKQPEFLTAWECIYDNESTRMS